MHWQIDDVIRSIKFTPKGVFFRLSAGQDTSLGEILYRVYYQTNLCDVVSREDRFGYPHNGGQHTFEYHGNWRDAVAMIELIKEEMDRFVLSSNAGKVAHELSYISQEILSRRPK
jgi:hypothetical protein